MKKQILFVAGLILMSASITFAQDSTKTDATQKSNNATQTDPSMKSENYTKDMTKIKSTEVPAGLKTTLGGAQYKGWEKGTIYKSNNNDGYLVEMTTNGKTTSHRFGADGKPSMDH